MLRAVANGGGGGGGSGTVTSVSVTSANGVTGMVANPTTTPSISVTLGAITPSNVQITGTGALRGSYGPGGVTSNFAAGDSALSANASGSQSVAVGALSLQNQTTSLGNTAVGYTALIHNTTGGTNSALGLSAGFDITTGSNNTTIGSGSGGGITTGSGNTVIGANVTGLPAALTNNVIIASGDGTIRAQHNGSYWSFSSPVAAKGYTVATLPTGVQGMRAFVTDALTPAYLALAVGGGAVVSPVFYNGTQWVTA